MEDKIDTLNNSEETTQSTEIIQDTLKDLDSQLATEGKEETVSFTQDGCDSLDLELQEEILVVPKKKKILDFLWYAIFTIVFIITVLTCCSVAFFDCYIVDGRSMLGTVKNGDRVTVCVFDKPKVGDVIVLKKPDSNTLLIKRFIAKGPALVKIDEYGNVYVDDLTTEGVDESLTSIYEPYVLPENKSRNGSGGLVPGLKKETESGYIVEEGKIFYLGDNRAHSTDSRSEGAVDQSLIIGKVSDYFLKIKDKKVYKFLNNYYIDKIKQKIRK